MKHTITCRLILVFLISVFAWSCSVQKRHYTKGYYVSWKKTKSSAQPAVASAKTKQIPPPAAEVQQEQTSTVAEPVRVHENPTTTPPTTAPAKNTVASAKTTPVQKLYKNLEQIQKKIKPEPGAKPKNKKNLNEDPAIIALVFAILGLTFLPLIGSIIGLVLANSAIRKIAADPGTYGGGEIADVAKILSIIGLILSLLVLLFILLFLVILAALFI